jgi:hypothetical protein
MSGISLLLLLLIEYKYFYIAALFTYVLSTKKILQDIILEPVRLGWVKLDYVKFNIFYEKFCQM